MDTRYRFFANRTPQTNDIVILDISEESIKRLEPVYGRWPWPRSVHGEVVEYLRVDGAKAIGFDIIFSEQTTRQEIDPKLIDELQMLAQNSDLNEVRAELLGRLKSLRPDLSDAAFTSAVKTAGNVFQPSVLYVDESDFRASPELGADEETVSRIRTLLSASTLTIQRNGGSQLYFNATLPFDNLTLASRGVGYINILPDKDGTCRRFYPYSLFINRATAYPCFPLLIATFVRGTPLDSIKIAGESISVGETVLPLLPDYSAFINYQGGEIVRDSAGKEIYRSFYEYIPYEYVLASKDFINSGQEPVLPRGKFKDKIVLISASTAGLSDLRATPFSPVTPGIEIHANIIDNILSNKFLSPLNRTVERAYIVVLALTIALLTSFTNPFKGFFFSTLVIALVEVIHWRMFASRVVLPLVNSAAAMILTYLGIVLLKYASELREKNFVKRAFGHYIAPRVLDDILKSPDKLKLGGERKQMTVLFSDIEDFSSVSERLSPEELNSLINEYLSSMVTCVMQTQGTLDKFIGDALMAFWNAPVNQSDHASRACETALLMMKELERLREKWNAEGKPPLNIRVGINTGEMVVGNMGSQEIFDYTVLGPEVNIAARLEPLNKDFGTRIVVSHSTRSAVESLHQQQYVFRRLTRVLLKGMSTPLDVHELMCFRDRTTEKALERVKRFEQGVELFVNSRFVEAKTLFQELLEMAPSDGPTITYRSLCEKYMNGSTQINSSSVYLQKSK